MNDVFRTVIAEGIVVVYLDDILIFTKTEEEHEWVVWRVLEIVTNFIWPYLHQFSWSQCLQKALKKTFW